MDTRELAAELARHGMSASEAAEHIGIGKKAFYSKMKGKSQFKLCEIRALRDLLSLTAERVTEIFFC